VTEASLLTLDLDALASNHAALKAAATSANGGTEIAPAVKADGYGLGAALVAGFLWDDGARAFYVARLSEGLALRRALGDRKATIYVLDGVTPGSAPALEAAKLTRCSTACRRSRRGTATRAAACWTPPCTSTPA
jgi:alanine racemase